MGLAFTGYALCEYRLELGEYHHRIHPEYNILGVYLNKEEAETALHKVRLEYLEENKDRLDKTILQERQTHYDVTRGRWTNQYTVITEPTNLQPDELIKELADLKVLPFLQEIEVILTD